MPVIKRRPSDVEVRAVIRATTLVPSVSIADAELIVGAVIDLLRAENVNLRDALDRVLDAR